MTTPIRFNIERMETPCGLLLLVTDDEGSVRALDWEHYEVRMHRLLDLHYGRGAAQLTPSPSNSGARSSLEAYFTGDLQAIEGIVVKTGGTSFQRKVWAALRTIPVGTTVNYGALAMRIEQPRAIRAAAAANGANPVSIIIPCHRVIGANGSLTGYAGGLERKQWLLEHEGAGRTCAPH